MDKAPDNKALAESDIPFPWESEFGRRLTMGDICYYAPGMLNKIGKEGRTSWDSFSYALMMGHNVYQHIVAVQRANHLMDVERAKHKPDWRHWKKLDSKNINSDEYSEWVPRSILYFDRFVEELFNTKTKDEAFAMIDKGIGFLRSLEGSRLRGGPAQNTFNNFFEIDVPVIDKTVSEIFAMPELDESKLDDLENKFNEDL